MLSDIHIHMLKVESGLGDEIIAQRGYETVTSKAELKRKGFSDNQARVPALLIPLWTGHGDIGNYCIRPETPRIVKGKPHKYEFPFKSTMVLDIPPTCRSQLGDPSPPLWITEGAKKGDALASHHCAVVSVIGVWNWRGTNGMGGKTALADWEYIHLKGRKTFIVFDSDVMTKPEVHTALTRLTAFLKHRGAHVLLVYLPGGPGGKKVGVDDFLVAGHTVDDLVALATPRLQKLSAPKEQQECPYEATEQGMLWNKPTEDGSVPVPLTNFSAEIISDLSEDDGAETRRLFEIIARVQTHTIQFKIPANQFTAMHWVMQMLGAKAFLHPGFGIKEHVRAAIQLLSEKVQERTIYTHTGWRKLGDQMVFLHGGGAIGTDGTVQGVEVSLPQALSGYWLPDSPTGPDLVRAVVASYGCLDLAPPTITFALLAATYRAVLGGVDFSVHMSGPTGAGKTELAAIFQQHYGPQLDARHLPGNWSSTANALEVLGFQAKDCLFVVDDFAPSGSPSDVQRAHREADRLLRAQGNKAGRQRLRPDATVMPTRSPRGLFLSTGEDVPKGHSIRSRMMILEVGPYDVNWDKLTLRQEDACHGLFAQSLSGFLQWVAPQYETIRQSLTAQTIRLRQEATNNNRHRRTSEITANLGIGLQYFLTYAVDVGAFTPKEKDCYWEKGWDALCQAAELQTDQHAASEPTARFIQLLQAAVSSGDAHFASTIGQAPHITEEDYDEVSQGAFGWRYEHDRWNPQGDRVGWIDPPFLYLQPDSSYKVVQKLGQAVGDSLSVTPQTLRKRLKDKGLLVLDDSRADRTTTRKMIEGQRREVLCLHLSSFISPETYQTYKPDKTIIGNDSGLLFKGSVGTVSHNRKTKLTRRKKRKNQNLY